MCAMFSSEKANQEFATTFTTGARAALSGNIADSSIVYQNLGRLWAQVQRSLVSLPQGEAHVPEAGSTLAADVKDAVLATLDQLWNELTPTVTQAGKEPFTLRKRVTSIEAAHDVAMRGAVAFAASAADRAAATPYQGMPIVHAMTPQADPPSGLAPSGFETPRETERPEGGPDLVDVLLQRMSVDGAGPEALSSTNLAPGNGSAPAGQRAAAVAPALARAANRLVSVGCPPLRVERLGGTLALHILQTKDTFTSWVESKGLSGAQLREALTIARSLDLGTHELGAAFLLSGPSEVLLRRLISVALAAKLGSYKLSQNLEEIPGDSALAELPDAVLKGLQERLKLEMKIEQLTSKP